MENVKKFYDLAEKDEGLKTELINANEKIRSKQSDFDGIRKLIEDEILPLAKKKDLGFTVDELLSFANEQYTELSEEELLEVSGGLSARNAAIGLSTVLLLSLGGTSATNFLSHNNDLSQSISMSAPAERQENQIQENEKQINEENDSVVYQNELDTKESEERNTQDKAAEEVDAKIQQNEESEPTKQTENNNGNINAKEAETQDGKVNDIEEAVAQGEDAIFGRLQERFDKGRFDYAEDEEGPIFGGLQDKFDEERRDYEEDTDQGDIEKIEGGNIAQGEDSILGNIVDIEENAAKGEEDATSANVANGEGIADQAEGDTKADKKKEERREEAKAPEDVETENVKDVTNEQIPPSYEMNSTNSFRATMVADIASYLRTVDGNIENVPKEAREGLLKNVEFVRSYIRWYNGSWTIRQGDVEHEINSEDAEIIIDFDDDYNSAPTIGDGSTVSNAVEENGPQVSEETQGNEGTGVETDEVQEKNKGIVESEVGKEEAPEEIPVDQEPETAERESNGEPEGADAEGDQEVSEDKQSAEKETDAAVDNQEASEEAKVVDKKAETKEESAGEHENALPEARQEDSTLKEKEPDVAPTVSKETHSGEKEGAKTGGQEDRTEDIKRGTTEAEVEAAVPTGDKAEAKGQEDGTEQAEDKAEGAVQDIKTNEKSSYKGQSFAQKMKKSREILVIELAEYLRSIEGNLDNVQKSDQNRLKKDVKEALGWLTEKNSKEGTVVYEVEKSTPGEMLQWLTAQPKSIISKADGTIIKDFARKYDLESYDSKGHVEGTPETNTEKQEDAESKSIQIEISRITAEEEAPPVETAEAGIQGENTELVDASIQEENAKAVDDGAPGASKAEAEESMLGGMDSVDNRKKAYQGQSLFGKAKARETLIKELANYLRYIDGNLNNVKESDQAKLKQDVQEALGWISKKADGSGYVIKKWGLWGRLGGSGNVEEADYKAIMAFASEYGYTEYAGEEAGVQGDGVSTADASVQGDIATAVETGVQGGNAGTAEAAIEAADPPVEKKDSKEDQEIGADHEMASEERERADAEGGQEGFGDEEADRPENSDANSEAEGTESSLVSVTDAEGGHEASEEIRNVEGETAEEGSMLGGMQDVFDKERFDEEDKEEDSMAQHAEAVEAEVPPVEEKDRKENQEIGTALEVASEEREGADAEGDQERFGDGEVDRPENSDANSEAEGNESSFVSVSAAEGDQETSEGKQKAEGETDVSADNQEAPEGAKVEEKAVSEGKSAGEQKDVLLEVSQEAEVNEIHYDPPPRFLTGEMVKYVANYLRGVKGNLENVPEEDKEKLQEDVEFLVKHFPSSQYTAKKYGVHGINSEFFEISETDFEAIFEFKVRGKWTDPQKYGEYDEDIAKKEKDAQESYRELKISYKAPEWSERAQKILNWKRTPMAISDRVKAVEKCLEFTSGDIEHVEDSDRAALRAEVADLVKDMEYDNIARYWKIRDCFLSGTEITDNQARVIRTFHEKYNQ